MKQRRQYLVMRALQLRYVRMTILPLLVITTTLYYLIYFMVMQQMGLPETIAYNLIPALKKVNVVIALIGPIVFLGLFTWIILATHKVAGPIYRLEKDLARIADGDFSVRIRFRKGDELASLADGLNKVLDKVEHSAVS